MAPLPLVAPENPAVTHVRVGTSTAAVVTTPPEEESGPSGSSVAASEHSVRAQILVISERMLSGLFSGRWPALLLGLWLLGASFGVSRVIRGRIRMVRLLRGRQEISEGALRAELDRLCVEADWDHPVRLTVSRQVAGPLALGRKEICLPARALTELNHSQQRSVLAHELAHLIRRDPDWRLVGSVMEAIFFFQPLNRVARRGINECAEYLCDDWAVSKTGEGLTLARCLMEVAGWLGARPRRFPAAGMASAGSPLVRRVERLLDGKRRRETHFMWRASAAVSLLLAVVLVAPGVTATAFLQSQREAVRVEMVESVSAQPLDALPILPASRASVPGDDCECAPRPERLSIM